MSRHIPLTIFTISFLGSMALTTIAYQGSRIVEANPIMRFMFSRSTISAWIYGMSVAAFILLASHFGFKKRKYTRTYQIAYWLLAGAFFVNFVREVILLYL